MRRFSAVMVLMVLIGVPVEASAEPGVTKVLTSVAQNIHVADWSYQGEAVGAGEIKIVKSILHGGKQEGVDVISVDNGKLTIVVVPTRGMSVLGVTLGEIRLGWDSPVREVVHPALVNLHDRGGLGWLDGFNEWMVRCGLEFAGHPGTDKFQDNTGAENTRQLTLHGKVGNIPASEVEVVVDAKPPHRIRIRGRVDERSFYGAQLEIWTEISTLPGSSEFRIDDVLSNRGDAAQEFELIYHCNYGPPLLEKGAKLRIPVRKITPMNATAAAALDEYGTIAGPTPGISEQVFLIKPLSDLEGKVTVLLENAAGDRGTTVRFSSEQLPYLTIWKNQASHRAGYVTGIEPGTCYPFNRQVERQAGRLPRLGPDRSRKFSLEYAILDNRKKVEAAAAGIQEIQEGQPPEVVREPPILEEDSSR